MSEADEKREGAVDENSASAGLLTGWLIAFSSRVVPFTARNALRGGDLVQSRADVALLGERCTDKTATRCGMGGALAGASATQALLGGHLVVVTA